MIVINDKDDWRDYLVDNDIGNFAFDEERVIIGEAVLDFPFTSEDVEEAIEEMNSDYYLDEFDEFVYEDLTDFA